MLLLSQDPKRVQRRGRKMKRKRSTGRTSCNLWTATVGLRSPCTAFSVLVRYCVTSSASSASPLSATVFICFSRALVELSFQFQSMTSNQQALFVPLFFLVHAFILQEGQGKNMWVGFSFSCFQLRAIFLHNIVKRLSSNTSLPAND
eukprot:UN03580